MLNFGWTVSFFALAALYGLFCSLLTLGAALVLGRPLGWRALPFLGSTLTFVFLTQHPFPMPGSLACPVPLATPQLVPFGFFDTVWRLERRGAEMVEFLANQTLVATAMNFLLCFAIGMTTVRHMSLRTAALFGVGLTLCVELTQLTGIWGLYPCAYRQFNVDDLLMNALGVAAGALVAQRFRRENPCQN